MEGLHGLFKGNGTTVYALFPNSAVKFLSYEEASKGIWYLYQQQTGNDDAQGRCCLVFAYHKEGKQKEESSIAPACHAKTKTQCTVVPRWATPLTIRPCLLVL